MSFFKKVLPTVLGLFLIAGATFAQVQQGQQGQQITSEDVSKEELENFVATAGEIQKIQQEAQQNLQAMVQEEGLEFQRFQMIMVSKQNPQMADSIEVSAEEQKAFEAIQPKMQKVNQQMMKSFQSVMQENDLTQQRFQQLAQAMRSDQELQQRFQKLQAQEMNAEENSDG